jgi:D-3-phosphoglycerate dehydrogenase
MSRGTPVAVTSRSFSQHPKLREELLARYQPVTFNETGESLFGDRLIRFLRGHTKAITGLERIDDRVLAGVPELKVISKYGVGLDMLDLAAMSRRGVALGWTGGVNRRSVAELVVSFAIALLHRVPAASDDVQIGKWRQLVGRQLTGRTIGIIGCGHVGKEVAILMRAFGCRVLAHDLLDFPSFYARHEVTPVPLDVLLAEADVVTLHLPLDDSTRGMLSGARLAGMKRGAVLINTARGEIVDEAAVKAMLMEGRLAGAAFDVFAIEPPADFDLIRLPTFIATPHIGGSTEEAILAMGRAAIDGLDRAGDPLDVVRATEAMQDAW